MRSLIQDQQLLMKKHWPLASAALLSALFMSLMLLTPSTVQAQAPAVAEYSLSVVHDFIGTDGFSGGQGPNSILRDTAGNFYGTTAGGGSAGLGTIFKVDSAGKETVLHSFTGPDGSQPWSYLIQDAAGNFYGMALVGGNTNDCQGLGCGTVYKLDTGGTLTVLHTFTGSGNDGMLPTLGVVQDAGGNLYGTAQVGGTATTCVLWPSNPGCGIVFKIDAKGQFSVLHSFQGPTKRDGAQPVTTLIMDATGNLYGTTVVGGFANNTTCAGGSNTQAGCGTVWKLDTTTGRETVLHRFTGANGDGAFPDAGLYMDSGGNLYGTTYQGGNSSDCNGFYPGCGTVFKIDSKGRYTVLHRFTGLDGQSPNAPLSQDAEGNFYGTTNGGGHYGTGTVFRMTTTDQKHYRVTPIFNFTSDDSEPKAPGGLLSIDADGSVYGVTAVGGGWNGGTVYKLTPH